MRMHTHTHGTESIKAKGIENRSARVRSILPAKTPKMRAGPVTEEGDAVGNEAKSFRSVNRSFLLRYRNDGIADLIKLSRAR